MTDTLPSEQVALALIKLIAQNKTYLTTEQEERLTRAVTATWDAMEIEEELQEHIVKAAKKLTNESEAEKNQE